MSRTPTAPPPRWLGTLIVVVLVGLWAWQQLEEPPVGKPIVEAVPTAETSADTVANDTPARTSQRKSPPADSRESSDLVIPHVTVKDQSGRVVYRGDVDLAPTLDRIERGERHPHRNDGGTFRNLEGRLPKKPSGYYREYVHPTPELDGPGPQRVVLGRDGEIYYTADHYQSFRRIR
ncbi:MAG: ribonuclease domain-containing protein [Planctomycetaceae bacterium]|nr:ribonuclease domain-containing protein [Planctomycetaceae bacterium]